jgi:hypothetical protein
MVVVVVLVGVLVVLVEVAVREPNRDQVDGHRRPQVVRTRVLGRA